MPEFLRLWGHAVREYWEPGYWHTSRAYQSTMQLLEDADPHIQHTQPTSGTTRFVGRVKIVVFVLSGLTAGLAAFMGASFYGSASCADATGYELYVIASAVVGGASLSGGKGSAVSAMLGALLIVLIRQSIRTLHFDQNYEWIIIGCAVIIAVVLDQASARFTRRRLTMMAK